MKNIMKNSGLKTFRRLHHDTIEDMSMIFSAFDNSFETKEFFNYINTRHTNIKFTMETEVNKIIPFLDVLIDNSQNIFKTSTYHKSTYSGLLFNYTSFTSRFYKIGLIKYLIHRTYKINNSWPGFHDDVSKIKDVLKRNSYPPFILDKIIKAYINKIHYNNNKVSSEINKLRYFKHILASILNKFRKKNCVNNIAMKIMSKLYSLHLK